jgi:hypothetical protein
MGAVRAETASPSPQPHDVPSSTTPKSRTGSVAPGGKPASAQAPRALREAIAKMLEPSLAFRTYLDDGAPKLLETKFAGPIQKSTDLFRSPETIYCVSAKLDIFPFPTERVAILKVVTGQDGKTVIGSRTGLNNTPFGCRLLSKEYGPFPEMDALRRRRREAMGNPN